MKYYSITPTVKKSVLEFESFRKEDKVNTGWIWATKELGWRTGTFYINVPETDDEIDEWVKGREDVTREDIDEMLKEGHNPFLPTDKMDFIDLQDYDYEMDTTWDGCWETWEVVAYRMSDDEREEVQEALEEGYDEDGWDYLEENNWESIDCYFEIHCPVVIEEIDDPWEITG